MKILIVAFVTVLCSSYAAAETIDYTNAANSLLDFLHSIVLVAVTSLIGVLTAMAPPVVREVLSYLALGRLEKATDRVLIRLRARYLSGPWTVEIENEYLAEATKAVIHAVPGAIKRLEDGVINAQKVRDFVEGRYRDRLAPPAVLPSAGYVGNHGLT